MRTKVCIKCSQELPATPEYFNRDSPRKDGLSPYCKLCRHAYRAEQYRQNPQRREKARKRARDWFNANRQRARQRRKVQYWRNPEVARQATQKWATANREKKRERDRQYKAKVYYPQNRDKYRIWARNRRAQKAGSEGTHGVSDIRRLFTQQEGKCFYCQTELQDGYHVDHIIPLSRGGPDSPDNLALTCPHCNLSKGDRLPDEWSQNPSD